MKTLKAIKPFFFTQRIESECLLLLPASAGLESSQAQPPAAKCTLRVQFRRKDIYWITLPLCICLFSASPPCSTQSYEDGRAKETKFNQKRRESGGKRMGVCAYKCRTKARVEVFVCYPRNRRRRAPNGEEVGLQLAKRPRSHDFIVGLFGTSPRFPPAWPGFAPFFSLRGGEVSPMGGRERAVR